MITSIEEWTYVWTIRCFVVSRSGWPSPQIPSDTEVIRVLKTKRTRKGEAELYGSLGIGVQVSSSAGVIGRGLK